MEMINRLFCQILRTTISKCFSSPRSWSHQRSRTDLFTKATKKAKGLLLMLGHLWKWMIPRKFTEVQVKETMRSKSSLKTLTSQMSTACESTWASGKSYHNRISRNRHCWRNSCQTSLAKKTQLQTLGLRTLVIRRLTAICQGFNLSQFNRTGRPSKASLPKRE